MYQPVIHEPRSIDEKSRHSFGCCCSSPFSSAHALRPAPEARATPARRARDVAYALRARRLAVQQPFAALADHDVRIGRAYRAAERTVCGGAEKLRHELAGRRIPLRKAPRKRVRLGDPQESLVVERDVRDIVHPVAIPLAREPTPALAADAANFTIVLGNHNLAGKISITSDMQMIPPLWQKAKKN